jgi:hypothetical protein
MVKRKITFNCKRKEELMDNLKYFKIREIKMEIRQIDLMELSCQIDIVILLKSCNTIEN